MSDKKAKDSTFQGDMWSDQEITNAKRDAFDRLSEEYDGIAVQTKSIAQFRGELVESIFSAIRKETANSTVFMETADYLNAKLTEAKVEGLHKALSLILEASTIEVKE